MRRIGDHSVWVSRLITLLFVVLSLSALNCLAGTTKGASELRFAVLQTKTGMYTNVTVTQVTKKWIFILHATGVCNVKPEDLSPETRTALGYDKILAASEENSA